MNPTAVAMQLAEKRKMLGTLQQNYASTEYKLNEIQKEREKLDANEKVIRSLYIQAPARIAQLSREIEELSVFSPNAGRNQDRRLDKQAKAEIVITEVLAALAKLDKGSAIYKIIRAELDKAALDANN